MSTFPVINGNEYSYSSVEIDLGSAGIFSGISELSYKHSVERSNTRGTSGKKGSRTKGDYDAEGSLTFYKGEYDRFIKALGNGYMTKSFNVTVTYAEDGQSTITDRLVGCLMNDNDQSHSEGNEALTVTVGLDILEVQESGLRPF